MHIVAKGSPQPLYREFYEKNLRYRWGRRSPEKQKQFVYAEEADILNVVLFGMTAKEWRTQNPELAKNGNIRDYTDLLHLTILNNLENLNAEFVKMNLPQRERLIRLNEIAVKQMKLLIDNKNVKELELLENKVNNIKKIE